VQWKSGKEPSIVPGVEIPTKVEPILDWIPPFKVVDHQNATAVEDLSGPGDVWHEIDVSRIDGEDHVHVFFVTDRSLKALIMDASWKLVASRLLIPALRKPHKDLPEHWRGSEGWTAAVDPDTGEAILLVDSRMSETRTLAMAQWLGFTIPDADLKLDETFAVLLPPLLSGSATYLGPIKVPQCQATYVANLDSSELRGATLILSGGCYHSSPDALSLWENYVYVGVVVHKKRLATRLAQAVHLDTCGDGTTESYLSATLLPPNRLVFYGEVGRQDEPETWEMITGGDAVVAVGTLHDDLCTSESDDWRLRDSTSALRLSFDAVWRVSSGGNGSDVAHATVVPQTGQIVASVSYDRQQQGDDPALWAGKYTLVAMQPPPATVCTPRNNLSVALGVTLGSTACLAFVAGVYYLYTRWRRRRHVLDDTEMVDPGELQTLSPDS